MTRKINKERILSKMNASQLLRFIELGQSWLLPELEVKRRTTLIQDTINDYSSVSETFDKFFKLKGTVKSIKPALIMAHLRPISDVMLTNFIQGLCKFMLFLGSKNEEHAQNCETLMRPSLNKLQEFLESDLWRNLIIGLEVTGEESQTINGMTIPFSHEAILMHIERIGAFPLIAEDIATVKASYRKYNEGLYNEVNSQVPESSTEMDKQQQFEFNIDILDKIHSLCFTKKVLTCSLLDFIISVGFANFSLVTYDTKQRMQFLIYRLSKIMGKEWYEIAAISNGWSKNDCSKHGKLYLTNDWAKKIYKLTTTDN